MRFRSVCSGIEAASVAWHPLGWRAAWVAEIEAFPSAVLAHHYPDVPNLGDMTNLPEAIVMGQVEAPDVFCGGTPCQAFSVAGLRKSLDDARGNLSLTFCEIANAIDISRAYDNLEPCIIFYENVPGILNTKDNAFGCLLAGLAGEDDALVAPGGKWSDAGCVFGPQRAVAWRILDAQFFGLAQRRRRVFVVASARDGFDPAQVLFEWEGDRRDFAPSRKARQVAPTIPARSTGGGGLGTDFDCDGGLISMAHGQGGAEIARDMGPTPTCNHEAPIIAHALRGEGFDASEDGTGRGTPLVPVHAFDARQSDVVQYGDMTGPVDTDGHSVAVAIVQNQRDEVRTMEVAGALAAEPGAKQQTYIAQPYTLAIRSRAGDSVLEARQDGTANALLTPSGGRAGIGVGAIAFQTRGSNLDVGDISGTIGTNADRASGSAPMLAFQPRIARNGRGNMGDVVNALQAQSGQTGKGDAAPCVAIAMQVRRLTPVECERLQGFPDDYTAIPWRGKPADQCPDGPRYKALGNSWAVPCVRWIGWRIAAQVYGELA